MKRRARARSKPAKAAQRRTPPRAPAELPRREGILDAALAVIAERGTEAVTHRSVATKAGVPLGSTTYYFASRDELVREAFKRYVAYVFELLAQGLPEGARDAAGLTEYLVDVARRDVTGRWTAIVEYELMLRAARDPELAREFHRYERGLVS